LKSSELVIGEAYAYGDLYEARNGNLRRAVVIEKRPGGKIVVEMPKRERWSDKPDGEIGRFEVRSYYLNHTWAEELIHKAGREEKAATDAALKARAEAACAVIAEAVPDIERPCYIDKSIGFGYGARLNLEVLERIAEKLHRLASLDK